MPRMLDLIRNSQAPSNLMQFAARGALAVPPGETIEILVHLALRHKLWGDKARLTLAGWDEKASLAAAADPTTSAEVLGYFVSLENLRPCLLHALAENPSVEEESLNQLAVLGSRSVVEVLLTSKRVMSSPRLLKALQSNANLRPNELAEIAQKPAALETSSVAEIAETDAPDEVLEVTVTKYLEENAAELAAGKPVAAAVAAQARKQPIPALGDRRDSPLQKISKLDIRGRITLAMRGTKEDRSILIRDSTKLVAVAVLESPKVSDGEVEKFALQKNVLESVLRAIPLKRRFAKNYNIMRNLVYNPRTPLDLSLGLVKNLLIHDLKNLSGNKEVSDTIRKVALRMYRQKVEKKG